MKLSQESLLSSHSFSQYHDSKSDSLPVLPLHLTIEERVAHLILTQRPLLHSSLNPLNGNSLY